VTLPADGAAASGQGFQFHGRRPVESIVGKICGVLDEVRRWHGGVIAALLSPTW